MVPAVLVLVLVLVLLWKDTTEESEQFFSIVKTLLSFVQVLSFPSGRLPLFAADKQIQQFYARAVSIVSTVGLKIFSIASLDCILKRRSAVLCGVNCDWLSSHYCFDSDPRDQ